MIRCELGGETISKHPQRQPVSVAAYYCVFVPTVAARCRSSTRLSSSPPHTHHSTPQPHRHHTHTTQLNSHARALSHSASLWLLGTGRAVAAEQQSSAAAAKATNHPSVLRARLHTQQVTQAESVRVAHSLWRTALALRSLCTQQMAALSADLCLYVYLACAHAASGVLRAWCCCRCRRCLRCRCSVSQRTLCVDSVCAAVRLLLLLPPPAECELGARWLAAKHE